LQSDATAKLMAAFQEQAKDQLKAQYALYADKEKALYEAVTRVGFSLQCMAALLPLALSLMPGVARGAMFAKLIMPSSPLPGWIFTAVPVLSVPMLAVQYLALVQMASHPLISLGVVFYLIGALLPLYESAELHNTHLNAKEVKAKAWLFSRRKKLTGNALQLSCLACFAAFFATQSDAPWLQDLDLGAMMKPLALLVVVFRGLTNFFLTTVLACDILLMFAIDVGEKETNRMLEVQEAHDMSIESASREIHARETSATGKKVMRDGNGDGDGVDRLGKRAESEAVERNPMHDHNHSAAVWKTSESAESGGGGGGGGGGGDKHDAQTVV
jgi:hypothetical protein